MPATLTHVFPSGVKPVYRLRLASGREVTASSNHPFRTLHGWTALRNLRPGSRIAVPRVLAAPEHVTAWPVQEVVMLAHLVGDGCVVKGQPIHYTSGDEANLAAVEEAAQHFGIEPRRVQQDNLWHVYLPSPPRAGRGKRNARRCSRTAPPALPAAR